MRTLLIVALVGVSAPAFAERTVVSIGGVFGARANDSYDSLGRQQADLFGGARLMLSFENAPVETPPDRVGLASRTALVPELLVGFQAFDTKAEGLIGAGLRGELQLASRGRRGSMRQVQATFYLAARAEVIGGNHDPAGEFVIGDYVWLPGGRVRAGIDGGLVVRRDSDYRDGGLGAVLTGYVSFSL